MVNRKFLFLPSLSIGQIPSFMWLKKKTHTITNTYNNHNYYYYLITVQSVIFTPTHYSNSYNLIIVATPLPKQFNMFNSSIPSNPKRPRPPKGRNLPGPTSLRLCKDSCNVASWSLLRPMQLSPPLRMRFFWGGQQRENV